MGGFIGYAGSHHLPSTTVLYDTVHTLDRSDFRASYRPEENGEVGRYDKMFRCSRLYVYNVALLLPL